MQEPVAVPFRTSQQSYPPPVHAGRKLTMGLLKSYKRWISPMLPNACRFRPTCSEYMLEAVEKHGVARGVWMGIRRLGRCQPFAKGGFDPVR